MLESIGCDNRMMMEASCQRHGGVIEVAEILQDDGNEKSEVGKIASLFGESQSHNKASAEADRLD